jgi:hypothetical protein
VVNDDLAFGGKFRQIKACLGKRKAGCSGNFSIQLLTMLSQVLQNFIHMFDAFSGVRKAGMMSPALIKIATGIQAKPAKAAITRVEAARIDTPVTNRLPFTWSDLSSEEAWLIYSSLIFVSLEEKGYPNNRAKIRLDQYVLVPLRTGCIERHNAAKRQHLLHKYSMNWAGSLCLTNASQVGNNSSRNCNFL